MLDSILRPVALPASLVGSPAPCDMFDARGTLLLKAGSPISLHAGDTLLRRQIYCEAREAGRISPEDPLLGLREAAATLSFLVDRTMWGKRVSPADFVALARSVFDLWSLDADACIGYARLVEIDRPSVWHALRTALFAAELATGNGLPDQAVVEVIGAALTMNLAAMDLHDQLHGQVEAPDEDQRAEIGDHPVASAELLARLGPFPPGWLAAVDQHHENVDGSGYPLGLRRAEIALPARILRIADVLAAELGCRRRRGPRHWNIQQARDTQRLIRHIFGSELERLDPTLVRLLMSRLGAFPPGSLVRLSNGEIAVVGRRRGENGAAPRDILAMFGPQGRPLEAPRLRRISAQDVRIHSYAHDELPRLASCEWERVWGYGPPASAAGRYGMEMARAS